MAKSTSFTYSELFSTGAGRFMWVSNQTESKDPNIDCSYKFSVLAVFEFSFKTGALPNKRLIFLKQIGLKVKLSKKSFMISSINMLYSI